MPRRRADVALRSEPGPSSAPALERRTIARGARIVLRPGFANGQLQYAAPIVLGDQSFYVQLDTGSSDLVRRCQMSAGCQDGLATRDALRQPASKARREVWSAR
jgi:hypothetical protein